MPTKNQKQLPAMNSNLNINEVNEHNKLYYVLQSTTNILKGHVTLTTKLYMYNYIFVV